MRLTVPAGGTVKSCPVQLEFCLHATKPWYSERVCTVPASHSVGCMSETAADSCKLQLPWLQPVYAVDRRDTHTDIDDPPEQLRQKLAACLL